MDSEQKKRSPRRNTSPDEKDIVNVALKAWVAQQPPNPPFKTRELAAQHFSNIVGFFLKPTNLDYAIKATKVDRARVFRGTFVRKAASTAVLHANDALQLLADRLSVAENRIADLVTAVNDLKAKQSQSVRNGSSLFP